MDGGGFDLFSQQPGGGFNFRSQASSSGGAQASRVGVDDLDLNSQAAQAAELFPHLAEYGNLLQGGGDQGELRGRGSSLPPLRAQRTLGCFGIGLKKSNMDFFSI